MEFIQSYTNINWNLILKEESKKNYFVELQRFLDAEKNQYIICPNENAIFSAFDLCSFNSTKVIIIGQDPYHGPNQANGLSFSVAKGNRIPPSLRNIFKELNNDLNINIPNHGDLTSWAQQGVLLLNSTLTVRSKQAASHKNKGWEIFTDRIIKEVSDRKKEVIFLLWGKHAQKKRYLINTSKHHILTAAHPSPLSAHNGFFNCKHFSKTNYLLLENNQTPINWQI